MKNLIISKTSISTYINVCINSFWLLDKLSFNSFNLTEQYLKNISEDYYFPVSLMYLHSKHYKEAKPLLEQILKMNFSNEIKANTASYLGNIYKNGLLGKTGFNQAIEYFQIAHKFAPENPLYLKDLAISYFKAEHYQKAELHFKQILEINIDNKTKAEITNYLGSIYSNKLSDEVNLNQVIEYYQIAHKLAPEDPTYLHNLANIYCTAGRYAEAEPLLKKAIKLNINNETDANLANNLGTIYKDGLLGKEDLNQAIEYYQIAYRFAPKNPLYLKKLAYALSNAGNYKESTTLLKQALEMNVSDQTKAGIAHSLGTIYANGWLGKTNHDQAIKYNILAHNLAPKNSLYIKDLAYSYSNAGHYKESVPLLKQALEMNLSDQIKADIAHSLSIIYRNGLLGKIDHDQAIKYSTFAHEFAPENSLYLEDLAYAHSNAEILKKEEPTPLENHIENNATYYLTLQGDHASNLTYLYEEPLAK